MGLTIKLVKQCDCIMCQIRRKEQAAFMTAAADAVDRAMTRLYPDKPRKRRTPVSDKAKALLSFLVLVLLATIAAQRYVIRTQEWQLGAMGQSNAVLQGQVIELKNRIATMERLLQWTAVTASWYGDREHGRLTANGETFNRYAFTVASRTLAFGTVLLIKNPENGRVAPAVVNDRGPYIDGRQLDVSEALARRLGFYHKGVTEINIYILYTPGDENEGFKSAS